MGIDYVKRPGVATAPSVATPGAGAPGAGPSRISLTKSSPSVSLAKQAGQLRVNLNWQSRPPVGGGLFKRLAAGGSGGIDLDLGCLWELEDGSKGVVQALGASFGALDRPPYVRLSGDDRSGADAAGEDLIVNLAHAAEIRRVLVFACIYEGAPSFDAAQGVVTLYPASGPSVEVRLDEQCGRARMCAVAMLEGGPGGLGVRREVRYFDGGQRLLDEAYGWGMRWAAGRK